MAKVVPSNRWMRAIAILVMVLLLQASSAARADGPRPATQTSGQTEPLPPPGTHRLIRIGPQALVSEDDHGRYTMVDEPTAKPSVTRDLATATVFFSLIGFGVFWSLDGENGLTRETRTTLVR